MKKSKNGISNDKKKKYKHHFQMIKLNKTISNNKRPIIGTE